MVRQWQEFFYDGKYSETPLKDHMPDFVKYAESFGAYGEEISKPGELKEAFKNAKDSGKPAVINVKVEKSSNVFPMIPPGGGLSDMIGLQDCLASKSGIKKMWSESKWRRI
jgi:acetolactate synthase-1/2/3 large subunit